MAQGEFALVKELLEKAIRMESIHHFTEPDIFAMLADAAVQQRDIEDLRKYASLLEESAKPFDHKLYLATAHRAWGVLHRLEGQYEEAETRMGLAAAIFQGLDTRWQLGRTYFEWGHLAMERGDPARAKEHYTKALTLFKEMGAVPDAGRAQEELAKINR